MRPLKRVRRLAARLFLRLACSAIICRRGARFLFATRYRLSYKCPSSWTLWRYPAEGSIVKKHQVKTGGFSSGVFTGEYCQETSSKDWKLQSRGFSQGSIAKKHQVKIGSFSSGGFHRGVMPRNIKETDSGEVQVGWTEGRVQVGWKEEFRWDGSKGEFRWDGRKGELRWDGRKGEFRWDGRKGEFRWDGRKGELRWNGRKGEFRWDGRKGEFRWDGRKGELRRDGRKGESSVSPLCDMKVAHVRRPKLRLETQGQQGGTVLGAPHRVVELGETFIPFQVFLDYVFGLGSTTFAPGTYDLLKHNCNNFSNEVSQFLCGKLIPKNILDLPDEILSTPLGQTLLPLIESLSQGSRGVAFGQSPSNHPSQDSRRDRGESPDFLQLNSAIEEVR
uniref:PPPDE domain-containing protein n=1 Tax=Timema genevievae TaxID=629358 RepID=A0A7R9K9N9_TIMGE|nr:unnamed protein product [Timema genevievae]